MLALCSTGLFAQFRVSLADGLPEPVSYRAVYEISFSDKALSSPQPAALVSMTGRMVYELSGGACEGYSTTQRLVTSSQLGENVRTLEDVQLAGFEQPDGKVYQFVNRRLVDQRLRHSMRGAAEQDEGQTRLAMKEPEAVDLVLTHQVLFPVRWFRQMIAAAMNGEQFFSAYLFDGSDAVGEYFQTTATIGAALDGEISDKPLAGMTHLKRWPVTVAYFQAGESTEGMTPLYEILTILYENGLNGSLYLNFGDYALDAKLTSLELLPQSDCE